jgi:hypothetical protein
MRLDARSVLGVFRRRWDLTIGVAAVPHVRCTSVSSHLLPFSERYQWVLETLSPIQYVPVQVAGAAEPFSEVSRTNIKKHALVKVSHGWS